MLVVAAAAFLLVVAAAAYLGVPAPAGASTNGGPGKRITVWGS